ncbi:MAG: hypothetical protein DRH26_19240, partial [Deltaproteobacteria bacterium]
MPPTIQHYKSSLERTGNEWRDIHDWVDDPNHKNEHHDFTRIADFTPIIREKFGEEGVAEYINHIREDMDKKFAKLKKEYEE